MKNEQYSVRLSDYPNLTAMLKTVKNEELITLRKALEAGEFTAMLRTLKAGVVGERIIGEQFIVYQGPTVVINIKPMTRRLYEIQRFRVRVAFSDGKPVNIIGDSGEVKKLLTDIAAQISLFLADRGHDR